MNYIKHLNNLIDKIKEDKKLTPFHVSLYISLFHYWNLNHFRNPFSIARAEVMECAKIGSSNTYIRSLKELESWGYLEYYPSRNKQLGSKISMISFDNTSDNTTDNTSVIDPVSIITTDNTSDNTTDNTGEIDTFSIVKTDNTSDNTTDNTTVTRVSASINNIKHNKTILNNTNNIREEEKILNLKNGQVEGQKNGSPENLKNSAGETFPPSTLTEVQVQLNEKKKVALKKKSEGGEAAEHSFCQSPYFSLEKLREALANTDYAHANLKYYHEVINNWSESKGAKKKDWLATIKNWILRDVQAGKLVKVEQPVSNDPYDNDRFRERIAKYASIWNRGKS
jgi:hypothetical protein